MTLTTIEDLLCALSLRYTDAVIAKWARCDSSTISRARTGQNLGSDSLLNLKEELEKRGLFWIAEMRAPDGMCMLPCQPGQVNGRVDDDAFEVASLVHEADRATAEGEADRAWLAEQRTRAMQALATAFDEMAARL